MNDCAIQQITPLPETARDGNITGAQLLKVGESSCPELWERAQNLFNAACAEKDNKEHQKKLMDAGLAFIAVVLASGNYPVEKSFALNNVGLIMQAMNRMDEAEKSFAFALQMNPKHATILQNYGTVRMVKGDLKGANEWFFKALDKDSECAEARWNSALISLTFGDFRRGFINYEWRWKCGTFTWREFKSHKPKWNGQDLTGKTILLTHEQGFGDSIMFIRYAKMVKARGAAKVRYLCLPELECILKDVEGVDEVTVFRDENRDGSLPDHEFDYHCPLLSLPRIFKTRVGNVPWDGPYACRGVKKTENWFPSDRPNVGMVWAGRPEHANDKNRSMQLRELAPLFDLYARFYSLQFGKASEQRLEFWDEVAELQSKTFADTAAYLANIDLLITVDTAVAHLAGAMGVPTWVMLPTSSDWRWMLGREDSPWYPSLRLFRQETKGEWGPVVQRIKKELEAMA